MDIKLNAERFTGKAYINTYDKYRPIPPVEIIHQTLNYLNISKAEKIIDLGCGTGLSTKVWADYADEVIGIEPSTEMIKIARQNSNNIYHISYQLGYSNDLRFTSNSVDCITCSQSFHWMEPQSTIKEISRVLRRNGVLVIYDVIWPPSVNLFFEREYHKLFAKIDELTDNLGKTISHRWDKQNHVTNIRNSNHFQFIKETYYHKTETFSKEKFCGIALSQGGLEALLKRGFSEEEIGVTAFKNAVQNLNTPKYNEITYNYRVIYGVKK